MPRRQRIAEHVVGDDARLEDARRAVQPADGAGRLERVDGVDLTGGDRRDVLADRQLGDAHRARACALEHRLGQRHVLDPGPGGDALALELGERLDRAVLGHQELLEHVLGVARVGREDLEQAGLRDLADREVGRAGAVGAAVGAAREHRFHHLLRAGELERLDVEPGVLEVALLDRGEERQAGGDRPEADADLGGCLRARTRRHAERGDGRGARARGDDRAAAPVGSLGDRSRGQAASGGVRCHVSSWWVKGRTGMRPGARSATAARLAMYARQQPCALMPSGPATACPRFGDAAKRPARGGRRQARDVDVVLGRERDADEAAAAAAARGARRRLRLDAGAVDDRDPHAKRALGFASALQGDQQFARRRTRFVRRTRRAGRRS